jgi:hypothetical protein
MRTGLPSRSKCTYPDHDSWNSSHTSNVPRRLHELLVRFVLARGTGARCGESYERCEDEAEQRGRSCYSRPMSWS